MISKSLCFHLYVLVIIQVTVQEIVEPMNLIDFLKQEVFPSKESKYEFAEFATPYSHRSKREIRPVEFKFGNETIRLDLTPLQNSVPIGNLPVWTVETKTDAPSGHVYTKHDKINLDGIFYEDFNNKAVLYATYRNGRIYYDGICGEGSKRKIIRSLPERYIHSKVAGSNDHIIFEASEKSFTDIKDIKGTLNWHTYEKSAHPLDVIYPKILVVIESNYFKKFNRNILEAVKYLMIFWNSIGMKYREISYPRVNIMVTGIVIAKDDTALEFLYQSRDERISDVIKLSNFTIGGNNYFEFTFGDEVTYYNYDSVVLMTNLTVPGVAGHALSATMCLKYIVYVFDEADYQGTVPATHELGHTMGMTHDVLTDSNSDVNSSILNPFAVTAEKYFWSQRSLTELKEFAKLKRASCLEHSYRNK